MTMAIPTSHSHSHSHNRYHHPIAMSPRKSNPNPKPKNITKNMTKNKAENHMTSVQSQSPHQSQEREGREFASPPVLPHKVKNELERCLSWIMYNNQIDDFAELLCSSTELKIFVVNQCARHSSSHASCIRWSKKWSLVGHPECAESVLYAMTQSQNNAQRHKFTRSFPDNIPFCAIDVAAEVIFVDDARSFLVAKTLLLAERDCIGLDMETMVKQFPIADAPKLCQILQVATSTKALLFDLAAMPSKSEAATMRRLRLAPHCVSDDRHGGDDEKGEESTSSENVKGLDPCAMDRLLSKVFGSSRVVKVGMSFAGDLKLLRRQYPAMASLQTMAQMRRYLELEECLKFIRSSDGKRRFSVCSRLESDIKAFCARAGGSKREGGLATVVRHVLRRRVRKTEQLSNWSRRPLRLSQLAYAAIDAKCQVDVFHALHEAHGDVIEMCMQS